MAKRECNGCTLCCNVLPVKELNKRANEYCQHQRVFSGCTIHDHLPRSCKTWSCGWLTDPLTADLDRPDVSHYVIDTLLDVVTMQDDDDQEEPTKIEVIQIWCDYHHPDSHRDPKLRAYLTAKKMCGLVRYDEAGAVFIAPPVVTGRDDWLEKSGDKVRAPHPHLMESAK